MTQGKGTHLVRVYRGSLQVQHDLNTIMQQEDVNGADILGVVKPLQDVLIDMTPGVPSGHRCELWVSTDYDVDMGYFVELKRTRVIDGKREAVQALLTDAVEEYNTVLPVDEVVGFRSGDVVLVSNGVAWESSKVKSVAPASGVGYDYAAPTGHALTLYADCALKRGYAVGSTVRASTVHQVVDTRMPDGIRPYRILTLLQVASREVVS